MKTVYLPIALILVILAQCSGPTETAGGASDTEVGRIAGTARNAHGEILPHAAIDLCRSDTGGSTGEAPVRSTSADTEGKFAFERIPFGTYRLQGISQDSSHVFVSPGIQLSTGTKEHTIEVKMETGGAVYGLFTPGFVYPREIRCLNTAFRASVQADHSFSFPLLPEGNVLLVTIVVDTATGSRAAIAVDTVYNNPGMTDTLSKFPSPIPLLQGDSLVVSDFENASLRTPFATNWIQHTKGNAGTISIDSLGAEQSTGALWAVCAAASRQYSFGFSFGDTLAGVPFCQNLTGLSGVSFLTRITRARLRVFLQTPLSTDISVVTIDQVPEQWTRFTVYRHDFDLSDRPGVLEAIESVRFEIVSDSEGSTGRVWIDDPTLYFD